MINELDELNEEYNNYKKEVKKLDAKLDKEIKKLYNTKIKNLKQFFYERELKTNNKYRHITLKRQQLIDQIHKNSMFNIFEIGTVIAKLLTEFEGTAYVFDEGIINTIEFYFYEHDKVSEHKSYNSAIITTTSINSLNKKNIEMYPTQTLYNFVSPGDILLYYNDFKQDFIYFYDKDGNYQFYNRYPYIKDFIDSLILNKINSIDNFNINSELKEFIDENKQKVKKITHLY